MTDHTNSDSVSETSDKISKVSPLKLLCMDKIETLTKSFYIVCIEDHIIQQSTNNSSKQKLETIKFYKNKKNINFCPSICYQAENGCVSVNGLTSLITLARTSVKTGTSSCQNLLSTRLKIFFKDKMSDRNEKWSRNTFSDETDEKEESEEVIEVVTETTLSDSSTRVEHRKKTRDEVVVKRNVVREETMKIGDEKIQYKKKNFSKTKRTVLTTESSETRSSEKSRMSPEHEYNTLSFEELIPSVVVPALPAPGAVASAPPFSPPVPPRNVRNTRVIQQSIGESKFNVAKECSSPDTLDEQVLILSDTELLHQAAMLKLSPPLARDVNNRVKAEKSSQNDVEKNGANISTYTIHHFNSVSNNFSNVTSVSKNTITDIIDCI